MQGKLWYNNRDRLYKWIHQHRVGKWGLRPWGSKRPNRGQVSMALGARLREQPTEPTAQVPLAGVLTDVKKWFEEERSIGTEIREKHIVQQTKYQLEYEVDKQNVLSQHGSKDYNPRVIEAAGSKLKVIQMNNMSKKGKEWFQNYVYPFIGASARVGQNKTQGHEDLDEQKFKITCKGFDYGIWLVAKGTEEDLEPYVQDPALFMKLREETWLIYIDETALWLKLRGEEKVMISMRETFQAEKRRRVRKAIRNRNKQEEAEVTEAKVQEYLECEGASSDNTRDMIRQFYHSGGDKHRLTLINMSGVKNWFKPSEMPECHKKFLVLLVFCEEHVCSEWIDDEHKFKFDVTVPTPLGPVEHKEGEYTKLLYSYIEHRKHSDDQDMARTLLVWGQKKAWCDIEICCLLSRAIKERYGPQALIFCDCLGARWSEQSLLEHFQNQQLLAPYAPGSTAILQEPDTHEHAPFKANI